MARPRSEEKQLALLRAATETVAEQGMGAPTSIIAKRAGVAEGTLFRYFENKDALLSMVCDYLLDEVEELLLDRLAIAAPAVSPSRIVWDSYIGWALANPAAYATVNKLVVSGKLTEEQVQRSVRLCDLTLQGVLPIKGLDATQSLEFHGTIFTAIANATIDLVAHEPELAKVYQQAGYQAMLLAVGLAAS